MLLGIAVNLAGIVVMLRSIRRLHRYSKGTVARASQSGK